ncbi:DUF4232 domain-containing protein [Streptomyces sp. NPDC002067]
MRSTLRARAALGLASVAVLSLSLTACDGGADGTKADPSGAASSAQADAATDEPVDSSPAQPGQKAEKGQAPSSAAPARSRQPGDAAGDDDCVLGTTKIAMKEAGGMPSAVLLTATNNGSAPCSLYNAPFVSDPVAGHNLAVDEDSRPQAVVVLAPGRTAYAAITLAQRESTQNHRTRTVNVTLATKANSGTDGHTAVSSPGPAGLQINPSTRVTYWQTTEEGALR